MIAADDFGRELTAIRERLEQLYADAPTPALAGSLRIMSELALVAEGYAAPDDTSILPAAYGRDQAG